LVFSFPKIEEKATIKQMNKSEFHKEAVNGDDSINNIAQKWK